MSNSYPILSSGTILVIHMRRTIMAGVGTMQMAKKKALVAKEAGKDERVAVIVLKGSHEYREWLNSMSKDSLIPVASIVRDAVAKWATQRGYATPPEL
jgi:hypothetical protein